MSLMYFFFLFAGPCPGDWGASVARQQHQTSGEGERGWRDPQDEDQERQQPLLRWGAPLEPHRLHLKTPCPSLRNPANHHMHNQWKWHALHLSAGLLLQCTHVAVWVVWPERQHSCKFLLSVKQCILHSLWIYRAESHVSDELSSSAGIRFLLPQGRCSHGGIHGMFFLSLYGDHDSRNRDEDDMCCDFSLWLPVLNLAGGRWLCLWWTW